MGSSEFSRVFSVALHIFTLRLYLPCFRVRRHASDRHLLFGINVFLCLRSGIASGYSPYPGSSSKTRSFHSSFKLKSQDGISSLRCINMYLRGCRATNSMPTSTGLFFSLSLFIKNSNLVYTNKPFVSNLICYCEFTKYLFYNNYFGSDNISALP
jgi:hypothetical protein